MSTSGKGDYEVGYGKPPKSAKFQKGHKYYPPRKSRRKEADLPSMTDAVTKKVIGKDAAGNRRSTTLLERINFNLAMQAAKGDGKAAESVFRQIERERARARANPASGSRDVTGQPSEGQTPRKGYAQIMRDFADAMWEETYQKILDERRKKATDEEVKNETLSYIVQDYKECKQRLATDLEYRLFVLMLAAVQGVKLRPYIEGLEPGRAVELEGRKAEAHEDAP